MSSRWRDMTGARLLLVHVADGWAARHFDELKLRESEEIRRDREYLGRICEELMQRGFDVRARLAMGDPATELSRWRLRNPSISSRCPRTVIAS